MIGKAAGQNSESSGGSRRPSKRASLKRLMRRIRRRIRRRMARISKSSKRASLKQNILEDLVTKRVRRWVVGLSVKHLHGPKKIAYAPDELVVVCLVRNGRP